jgi:manganese/zinc/iron transport system permease protein
MAMMADAISHSILPGLVGGWVISNGPNLATGFMGAAGSGLATVFFVEALTKSRRVKEDAAIGIVFPALFALGVFLVTKYFDNVHLDADAILFGEIAYAPYDQFKWNGQELGPKSLWVLGALTVVNAAFLRILYKELKVSTFDPQLTRSLGFSPTALHYSLMALVAITTVGAFSAVGAILAVALIIVPPIAASLLTERLRTMIILSLVIGASCGLAGYWIADKLNVSISGMIATTLGLAFVAAFLFAPKRGVAAQFVLRHHQRQQFLAEMLIVHLEAHEGTAEQAEESRFEHLVSELEWQENQASIAVRNATRLGWLQMSGDELALTPSGRDAAAQVRER